MSRREGEKQNDKQQQGRRLVMFPDNKRQMLQSIRDSLSHVRKTQDNEASGQSKAETGRGDYNKEAMAKIRNQLEQFAISSDGDVKEPAAAYSGGSEDAVDQMRARELIQQLSGKDSFPRNGMSKFGGLVGPVNRALQRKLSVEQEPQLRSTSQPSRFTPPPSDSAAAADRGAPAVQLSTGQLSRTSSPPPPLPPPRQPLAVTSTTPPPPLPPRSSKPSHVTTAAPAAGTFVPPIKKSMLLGNAVVPVQAPSTSNGISVSGQPVLLRGPSPVVSVSGASTQGLTPLWTSYNSSVNSVGPQSPQQQQMLLRQYQQQPGGSGATAALLTREPATGVPASMPYSVSYNGGGSGASSSSSLASTGGNSMTATSLATFFHGGAGLASSGGRAVGPLSSMPPPPPYPIAAAASSSSVASSAGGSSCSGDYQLVLASDPLRHAVASATPEYRPSPAYSSSGSSSPATIAPAFQYQRPGPSVPNSVASTTPASSVAAWESVQTPSTLPLTALPRTNVQMLPMRPTTTAVTSLASAAASEHPATASVAALSTHQAPPCYRPPSPSASAPPPSYYTSSVQAHVGGGGVQQQPRALCQQQQLQMPPRGNVHIQLRNQKDPCVLVTGNPSFQVTAINGPKFARSDAGGVISSPQQQPAIQIQFGCPAPPHIVSEAHLPLTLRGGGITPLSREVGSTDSPVQRTTANQSPLSILSSASTGSDPVVPDRPPPPYPGTPSRLYVLHAAVDSDASESELGSGGDRDEGGSSTMASTPAVRCESPIPERKPEAEQKDAERSDTKVQHYSPQAFKFFMEQHVENVLKQHKERYKRRAQLENEMDKVSLCEEARLEMRRMLRQKESNFLRMRRAKMERSMFERIKVLGVGAFGEVALVRKSDMSHQLFAMKTLRKADVLRRNQVAHVKAERDILAEAECDWVVKLYYSFQDKDNLYFIMEYIPGGDMMSMLIKFGIFDEPLARFYIGELVLAIESVHRMGFIHRDIKPDNILIDRDGHIKLTDFGLCTGFRWTHNSKYYQNGGGHARQDSMEPEVATSDACDCAELLKPLERRRRRERLRCLAHSLVGTPNYIAPEVLLRSGYTRSCDWWSVGVILFEMLVGHPPFLANSAAETQYKVINWERTLRVPEEANLSLPATNLILSLCCDPDRRLGANGGADDIKRHAFFESLTFDGLRKHRAPYKPQIKHETDTSNFDPVDETEHHHHDDEDFKNGKYPEHAFVEFTFRRFFDDYGHPLKLTESLERHASDTYGGLPIYGRRPVADSSGNKPPGPLSPQSYSSHTSTDSSVVTSHEGDNGSPTTSAAATGAYTTGSSAGATYSNAANGQERTLHRTPENPVYV